MLGNDQGNASWLYMFISNAYVMLFETICDVISSFSCNLICASKTLYLYPGKTLIYAEPEILKALKSRKHNVG